ncbi:MAG TPA: glycosyltransferase family 4 protein [Candidatus Krumholzibacteria bacterium]
MTRRTGMRPLRIAMIGQKGIPARYGGVETHVEAIATRLAGRGHEVWAFCRSRLRPGLDGEPLPDGYHENGRSAEYHGVRLAYRPSLHTKHTDAASHALWCTVEASCAHRFDLVHLHGIGPSSCAPVARLFGRPVVSTFHALDWRQVKWGHRARELLHRGEALGARHSDAIIAVSRLMQAHVQAAHGIDATYIPNGAAPHDAPPDPAPLAEWGLKPGGYILTVGRIIPDRELHTLIEAFNQFPSTLRLVIVGSETPRSAYSDSLQRSAGERVTFTGDVFGERLQALYGHALFYVLASRVEGLPITVCEAMAHGKALVLSDIPENVEVGGAAARYFRCGDVNALLEALSELASDESVRRRLGDEGKRRCATVYNWDLVTDQVEGLYYRILSGGNFASRAD